MACHIFWFELARACMRACAHMRVLCVPVALYFLHPTCACAHGHVHAGAKKSPLFYQHYADSNVGECISAPARVIGLAPSHLGQMCAHGDHAGTLQWRVLYMWLKPNVDSSGWCTCIGSTAPAKPHHDWVQFPAHAIWDPWQFSPFS